MAIRVALHHRTEYRYARQVQLGPQIVRLRPAPHCRTPILSYSLKIDPSEHFCNWQQDPQGNFLARLVFNEPCSKFEVVVDLIADLSVINPFDFFLESSATQFPFEYEAWQASELLPFRQIDRDKLGPGFMDFVKPFRCKNIRTIDHLIAINQQVQQEIEYAVRLEPGVQTPDETLASRKGSCRDSAWLLVHIFRELGLAARFASGYLIQLAADQESLDGPSGPKSDFTDLHAWTEVYLPGAGWVGFDPTSGLLCGEGHLPLACSPDPTSASPVQGLVEPVESEFTFSMKVTRIHEDPRTTKPYTQTQWERLDGLGHEIDQQLLADDVRLTFGGEPTFASIDDMEGAEWNTAAVGPNKTRLASDLLLRLQQRFAPGGLLFHGQGKWYPGESLPRWAKACYWRTDGQPMWQNRELLANENRSYNVTYEIRCRTRMANASLRRCVLLLVERTTAP
jgi:transglutaminase-like putative cysteine protease